ncbi:MAG: sugar ABC transporter permease [Acidimicrobiia bacterium]|nr:sugar ABC transporter permease [Acidimicrobiia bacterium]
MNRLVVTVLGIVAAVGGSAVVFVGINKLFDLTEERYPQYSAIAGGLLSGGVFYLLWGNRMISSPVILTIAAIVIGAALGYALGIYEPGNQRLAIGVGGGAALGLLLGLFASDGGTLDDGTEIVGILPSIDPVGVIVGLVIGAALGFLIWVGSGRKPELMISRMSMGLAVGWLLGAWLAAELTGSRVEAIIVAVVLGALVGAAVGGRSHPDQVRRADIALGSRKYIFLAPALAFVGAALVIPLLRTIWLGFLTGNPRELTWTGLTNYADIFSDPGIIDFSGAGDIIGSRLFWLAAFLLVVGAVVGRVLGQRVGTGFSVNAGSLSLLTGGVVLFGFALFTAIRGTIPNNLWWIFSVIIFAVSLGLAVAVLADRAKGENIAKSLIFLPMAISFVGASVIWRLIYVARPPQDPQTGVFNSLWVMLGEWSNSGLAKTLVSVVLLAIIAALVYLAWRGWQAEANAIVAGSAAIIVVLGWLVFRFLGPGLGGFETSEVTGEIVAAPVLFIQEGPWNNFWLMVVFIWIQTGFAMVIFSAAIKAVPEDLLEAARIDGATESQTFWRVTVPQIFPTIGVVVTTLIVQTLKIFDIPKVMTNGNFDTQVLANEMWERAFTQLNFGLGSAVAVVLFVAVLPVMAMNIRRMQRERLG